MLSQPASTALAAARRVLIAGCGGGYDVLGAVPLLVELLAQGKEVALASHSFCYLNGLAGARQEPRVPNLYAVPASAATEDSYCPEAWLARWLEERLGGQRVVWAFDKTGVQPLLQAFRHVVEAEHVEAIVLVDGGIDALLRGDESALGTPSEDLAALAAASALELPVKLLACVGLGSELRDGICHEQVFARIAELTRRCGYLGAAALTPQAGATRAYRDAVDYVFAHQSSQRRSHVHKVISAAVAGEYGVQGPHVWISPLLGLYWFFKLQEVVDSHLFLDELRDTQTIWEVTARIEACRARLGIQERSILPI